MASSHRVDVGGVELYVEELGEHHESTVIFGHSLLCDGRMFADQVTDLARDHRVINIDFRAHGRSGVPRRRWTMADQGRDYLRVMDALDVQRAVVVGLSMGGMAALQLALRHPERLRGMVLLDTSAGADNVVTRTRYRALAGAARLLGFRQWLLNQATEVLFGKRFIAAEPGVVQLWQQRMAKLDRAGLQRAITMVTSRPSVVARLGEIAIPTLVIVGEEDVALPPALSRSLAQGIPDAELITLPGIGHLSTIEAPRQTSELIRRFCDTRAQGTHR